MVCGHFSVSVQFWIGRWNYCKLNEIAVTWKYQRQNLKCKSRGNTDLKSRNDIRASDMHKWSVAEIFMDPEQIYNEVTNSTSSLIIVYWGYSRRIFTGLDYPRSWIENHSLNTKFSIKAFVSFWICSIIYVGQSGWARQWKLRTLEARNWPDLE